MGDKTRATPHLTIEQVKEKMKEAKDPKQLQRWQIVYTALLQPRKAEEIAATHPGLVYLSFAQINDRFASL